MTEYFSQRNFSNVTSTIPPTLQPQAAYEDKLVWLRVVFYGVISIVGTVGNALVILAYRNPRMRSVTNLFIANLGVADLTVTLINVPITVTYSVLQYWPFGEFLCKAIPFILGVTLFSSVGTLIAIAADRYRAIVHPLLPRIRTRHAIMIIAAIWIAAFIYPIPLIIYQHFTEGRCEEKWSTEKAKRIFTVAVFAALYLIPLIAISVLYFLICHNLNTSESSTQEGARRARKSVIRMLVVVVVLFTVCWLPYHVMMMYDNFGGKMTGTVFQLIMFGFWLSFANSCCNPIVYAVLNRNYRKEFGRLLRCQAPKAYRKSGSQHGKNRRFSLETKTSYKITKLSLNKKNSTNEDLSMENKAMANSVQGNSSSGNSSQGPKDEKLPKKQQSKVKKTKPIMI